MFKVEICYPWCEEKDVFFDIDYYKNKHMPWAKELLGGSEIILDYSVEKGMAMGEMKPAYICKGILCVEKLPLFFEKMMAAADEFGQDLENFTNLPQFGALPVTSVYEVL